MNPTSENRRKVASNLRKIARDTQFVDGTVLAFDSDQVKDIADLIDPNCHMTDSEWDSGERTWGCICSACGTRIEHTHGFSLDYCPYCGARVMSDDDE